MATLGLSVGSLCSGYGGLELGLSQVIDTDLEWFSEIADNAIKVMDTRFGKPNLGDLTSIIRPPKVDIITAGFPCQPFSYAGYRKGIEDERYLIDDICRVAVAAEARWIILENVKGILTANNGEALARVAEALALSGFSRWEWTLVGADRFGACHRRERWFCIATNTDRGSGQELNFRNGEGDRQETRINRVAENNSERSSLSGSAFERYKPVIERWERTIGRAAPEPYTEYRLNIRFVEWMMGLPISWVCDDTLELTRTATLELLGNGVVPQQASGAIRYLFKQLDNQC